jgi:hypothetical protein
MEGSETKPKPIHKYVDLTSLPEAFYCPLPELDPDDQSQGHCCSVLFRQLEVLEFSA